MSYINTKLETIRMTNFKHGTQNSNLYIVEYMNDIYIDGETYSEVCKAKNQPLLHLIMTAIKRIHDDQKEGMVRVQGNIRTGEGRGPEEVQ